MLQELACGGNRDGSPTIHSSHDNKAMTTGESLKLTAVRFQMSEKEIMEWLTNYVRVDEVSRAYVKP